MVDFVDTDRGYAKRSSDFLTEKRGSRRALISIDELMGDDLMAEEGLSVGEVGV